MTLIFDCLILVSFKLLTIFVIVFLQFHFIRFLLQTKVISSNKQLGFMGIDEKVIIIKYVTLTGQRQGQNTDTLHKEI